MSGKSAFKLAQLIIALVILALILTVIYIKIGKPWSQIVRGSDRYSRYIEIAAIVVLLIIFAIFFFINNKFI